jgi:hypothetical protein
MRLPTLTIREVVQAADAKEDEMSDQALQETGHAASAGVAPASAQSRPALPAKRELSLEAVMDLAHMILRPAPSDGFAGCAQDDPGSER